MRDFILLMHDDARPDPDAWSGYFERLRKAGAFAGGSAIGGGVALRKAGAAGEVTRRIAGYIRIAAADLDAACDLVNGNPVYEAGGTVEVRELPRG